ncbi:MAG: flagellar basal body rod protein FlgB [Fimbriimonadales bacterium]|nr:flagellar basal body rod protein FlgB [Fimbriimonadales bacterium]
MELIDSLFGPHLDRLQRAMDRATRRQALLTENLANVNTPGYKRKDLDFNLVLEERLAGSAAGASPLDDETRQDRGDVRVDGSSVDLEREVMALAETELRYQALTDLTARYFSGLKNVIRGGR